MDFDITEMFDKKEIVCKSCGINCEVTIFKNQKPHSGLCPTCDEERAEREKKDRKEKERLERNRYNIVCSRAKSPNRYKEASLSDFPDKVSTFAQKWLEGTKSWLLLLDGSAGIGKTHFAYSCLFESHNKNYLDSECFFIYDLVRFLREDYTNNNNHSMNHILNLDLLIIDDIGAERLTEDSIQLVESVVHKREQNISKTIITTNLGIKELSEAYSFRLGSRLASGMRFDIKNGELVK